METVIKLNKWEDKLGSAEYQRQHGHEVYTNNRAGVNCLENYLETRDPTLLKSAIIWFQHAREFNPKIPEPAINLGNMVLLEDMTNTNDAEYFFQKALDLKNNHPDALLGLGKCYVLNKDYSRAVRYLNKAEAEYNKHNPALIQLRSLKALAQMRKYKKIQATYTLEANVEDICKKPIGVRTKHEPP